MSDSPSRELIEAAEYLPAEPLAYHAKIKRLEGAILRECEPRELETKHYFAHGTYTRELYIPKDTVLTGKIHRHSCINILTKGRIAVSTPDGRKVLEAPYTFVSGPGVQKAGYALEDSVWINVHPWDGEPDLQLIEREVIVPSYESLECEEHGRIMQKDKECLGAQ